MTNGVLCFANNNGVIDYIKQATFLANRVRLHLDLPTTLVTSSHKSIPDNHPFDNVIIVADDSSNSKRYSDGSLTHKKLYFKNSGRANSYDLTPYDQTLVLDTDYVICNDDFKHAFDTEHFQIYKDGVDLSSWRYHSEFDYINDTGIPFYWATCFCFKKNDETQMFFKLLQHIVEYWNHYKNVYDLGARNFRNDHAFSIAIHMMNGFEDSNWAKILPGKMFYTLDKDILRSINDNKLSFLLEKQHYVGEYTLASTKDINVHVMNKFSLGRIINV